MPHRTPVGACCFLAILADVPLALVMLVQPLRLRAQVAPDTTMPAAPSVSATMAGLAPGVRLRIRLPSETLLGTLAGVTADSLDLQVAGAERSLPLAEIDTLWTAAPVRHRAALAGAGFGVIMFALLAAGGEGSEDPGLGRRAGLLALGGSLALGVAIDALGSKWERRYPAPEGTPPRAR